MTFKQNINKNKEIHILKACLLLASGQRKEAIVLPMTSLFAYLHFSAMFFAKISNFSIPQGNRFGWLPSINFAFST